MPPHGVDELSHPEAGMYMVGMKSYGRAPTFLLRTGYEQVRSVVAALAGDWESARRVELVAARDRRLQPGRRHPTRRRGRGRVLRQRLEHEALADRERGLARAIAPSPGPRAAARAWGIVGALSVTETVSWGILYYAFAVFLLPMRATSASRRAADRRVLARACWSPASPGSPSGAIWTATARAC